MTAFALILVLAITAEALTEYAKTIDKMLEQKQYKTAVTQLAALVISVGLCIAAGANIYDILGVRFVVFAGRDWIGLVLTGIFASRGANYAADIVKALQTATQSKSQTTEDKIVKD